MEKNRLNDKIRYQKQFLYNIAQIIEIFPQYSITQHIWHILRRKNESKEAYFWSDELLLKKTEQYYDELKQDLLLNRNDSEWD